MFANPLRTSADGSTWVGILNSQRQPQPVKGIATAWVSELLQVGRKLRSSLQSLVPTSSWHGPKRQRGCWAHREGNNCFVTGDSEENLILPR